MTKTQTAKVSTTPTTPKQPTKQQRARFASSNGATLTIQLRPGRRGFNVSATLKNVGEKKGSTGARSSFAQLADAQKAFETLVQDAKQQGWKERTMSIRGMGAFAQIPVADPQAVS